MRNIPIVFLTDYGLKDEYVGVIKCVIYRINPKAKIIDITHDIKSYSVLSGTYIIDKIMNYVPLPCVILGVVDPGVGSTREEIFGFSYVSKSKIFFVGPNNGLFTPLFSYKHKVFQIDTKELLKKARKFKLDLYVSNTFHGRDIFAPVAAFLSLGTGYKSLIKKEIENPVLCEIPMVHQEGSIIRGKVLHIDSFGNIITNIKDIYLDKVKNFELSIGDKNIGGIRIISSYLEGKPNEIFGIIGSYRTLEISVREGSAATLLGVRVSDDVSIKIK